MVEVRHDLLGEQLVRLPLDFERDAVGAAEDQLIDSDVLEGLELLMDLVRIAAQDHAGVDHLLNALEAGLG